MLAAEPSAAAIVWHWDLDQPALRLRVDRGQIEQALLNVLKNAVEAIDGPGTITIRLTSRSGRPSLTIEDTGAGISGEAQANLFTPFFSTKPNGHGIGLTLVQEILMAHGFDYALERGADGVTRFTMLLRPADVTSEVAAPG